MKKLDLLVVGTGRCGTVAMANFLSSIGIPCGHEAIFTTGGLEEAAKRLQNPKLIKFSDCTNNISQWTKPINIIADSSYMAAPYLNNEVLSNTKIIHLVRHPINVIQSFVNARYFTDKWPSHTVNFQQFIKNFLPNVYDNKLTAVNRAALYYIEWNKMIEKNIKNHIVHRLEDDNLEIFNFVGIEPRDVGMQNLNSWPTYNSIFLSQLSTEIKTSLIDVASKYNYKIIFNKIYI